MRPWLGLLSGTSMDAATAVLCIPRKRPEILAEVHLPWPPSLRERFLRFEASNPTPARRDASLDRSLGEHFARAAVIALKGREAAGIGFHGQTAAHRPDLGWTLQAGDPGVVAEATGLPVWSAFRDADIEAGGQGAPLAPILDLHHQTVRDPATLRVNLGGILNATLLPPRGEGEPIASDIAPCNALLDRIWREGGGAGPFDLDGRETAHGRGADPAGLPLLSHPFLGLAPPKSTHTGDWGSSLDATLSRLRGLPLRDALATGARAIAAMLGDWVSRHALPRPQRVLLSGGGAWNVGLRRWIAFALEIPVRRDCWSHVREGILFAHLARQARRAVPASLPATTGARERVVLGRMWRAVSPPTAPPSARPPGRRPPIA